MSEGMEQIDRLMEQVARLYQEGRYKQAFAVSQQACDLARREVGARHPLFAASRGLDRDLALSEAQRYTRDATVAELRRECLTPVMIERLAAGDASARRHLEQLAQKPDDHRPFENPLYWGAFICQGDPSPLPSMKTAGEPEPQAGA
jgi:hypothetical protein